MKNHSPDNAFKYPGRELEIFALAHNWKRHFSRFISPYIKGDILEVGAGIGSNTAFLINDDVRSWTSLEPDEDNAAWLFAAASLKPLPVNSVIRGTIDDIPKGRTYDVILYLDVLEHIEDDSLELAKATDRLRPGGHLFVLAPAHPALYSKFDKAVGHYRRYTRKSLRNICPAGLREINMPMLDSIGLLVYYCYGRFRNKPYPSQSEVLLWDRVLIRISRISDPLTAYNAGKSVLGIWKKESISTN